MTIRYNDNIQDPQSPINKKSNPKLQERSAIASRAASVSIFIEVV